MTQDDDRGGAPGRPHESDAPTQALPQNDAPTQALPQTDAPVGTTRTGGSPFDHPTPPRPFAQHSPPPPAASGGTPGSGLSGAERRPAVPRPSVGRADARGAGGGRAPARSRRAKLAVRRIDPWSVFLFSLLASIFLGIVLVVAVTVLYTVLDNLGVLESVNELFGEVAGDASEGAAPAPELITSSRVLSGAAVLAAVDIVLLTALATLGALLYNLCAALTGGIEVTLGERD